MPLPIPNLDDRTFDDLVAEATSRIEAHNPEWSNIAPGDPGAALIDLFAWLAETIIYRQNLIPSRQRRAFLNLLALPMQPAAPARGVLCVDAQPLLPLPAPLPAGSAQFTQGAVSFTSTTDLQPTPLQLTVMIKARYREADPAAHARLISMLRTLYNIDMPTPFVAQTPLSDGALNLADAADGLAWLALTAPKGVDPGDLRKALAGLALSAGTLAIGLAPVADIPGYQAFDQAAALPARVLNWSVATQDSQGQIVLLPLEVAADTSNGGRAPGVTLLRLPSNVDLLQPPAPLNGGDPMYAGVQASPPELPAGLTADRVVLWLTLTAADPSGLTLGWLGVNATAVIAQVTTRDEPLGAAQGDGDAVFTLRHNPVDPASLAVEVWPAGAAQPENWTQVANFGEADPQDNVYVLDPTAGTLTFGDGIRGSRPARGATVVARQYAYGGGADGNFAPGGVKSIQPTDGIVRPALTVRQELPIEGGADGESVADAERRIPAYLAHRDRAVTADDFRALAVATPGLALGRAEVVQGLLPGADPAATRLNIPGVVSVFIWPRQPVAFGDGPVATLDQLRRVFAFLRDRILIGTQLFVLSAEPVPLYASVSIEVHNGADVLATTQAVQQALAGYFWALAPGGPDGGGWPLGRTAPADELLTQAARVPGVLAVDQAVLYLRNGSSWTPAASATLRPWQVPALQGVGVSADGGAPPAPPDVAAAGAPVLVPYVPTVC